MYWIYSYQLRIVHIFLQHCKITFQNRKMNLHRRCHHRCGILSFSYRRLLRAPSILATCSSDMWNSFSSSGCSESVKTVLKTLVNLLLNLRLQSNLIFLYFTSRLPVLTHWRICVATHSKTQAPSALGIPDQNWLIGHGHSRYEHTFVYLTLSIRSMGKNSSKIWHFEGDNIVVQLKLGFYDLRNNFKQVTHSSLEASL